MSGKQPVEVLLRPAVELYTVAACAGAAFLSLVAPWSLALSPSMGVGSALAFGAYGAIPVFLIFYLRFLGGHSWRLTGTFAAVTPVITFLFFEIALQKTLPKGFTDPWFEPIFEFFY